MPGTAGKRPVKVVTGEPDGSLVAAVCAELKRAGWSPTVVDPELKSVDGLLVLVDDPGLTVVLPRLYHLLPGRCTFPNTVLVVEKPERAGGILGEGFRDVVKAADVPRALDALLRGRPPVIMAALRDEIEGDFSPKFVAEMRQRALEKQTLVSECVDLVRAATHLEKRIFRLRRLYEKQAIDALLGTEAKIEDYLATLDERRNIRLARLPQFPSASPSSGVLGRREPRYRRAREEIEDAIDWLRQAGFLKALGKQGLEAMTQTATSLVDRPLQGLADCLAIVERETALRLSLIDRLQSQVSPIAVLEERCLDRVGFGILPPGIVVPDSVHLLIRSMLQPPAEIYVTWCLDLRDLRLKQCGEVLEEIARDLAWTREARAAAPGAAADLFEEKTQPLGPAQRM